MMKYIKVLPVEHAGRPGYCPVISILIISASFFSIDAIIKRIMSPPGLVINCGILNITQFKINVKKNVSIK